MVKIAQFGSWESPVTAELVAAVGGGPRWVDVHDGQVWWAQSRPAEGGRVTILREGPGRQPVEVLPAPWNARNRLQGYGGRPYTVTGGHLVFTHWADQRLYALDLAEPGTPRPIVAEPERHHGYRYADLSPGPDGTVLCVRETSTGDAPTDVRRDLVAVPLDGSAPRSLAASHHFMTGPRLSPDGTKIAWLGWDHPRMPWDGTELCVATLAEPAAHQVVAGGPRESVCHVEWETGDTLLALSDPDGWWNLFRFGLDGSSHNLAPCQAELGGPLWTIGMRWFAPLGGGRFAVLRAGRLAVLDEHTGTVTDVDTDLLVWSADLAVRDGSVVSAAGSPTEDRVGVTVDPAPGAAARLSPAPPDELDPAFLPVHEERLFTGPGGRDVPALVYPPRNPCFAGPDGAAPPFLVHVHGGPTAHSRALRDLDVAYFTSRGIGVVAVNYGGSTGYGRAFRESLNGGWGVVDVDDCAAVATALAAEGTADPTRLAIRGGSAGGWTAAASMTSVDTYRCGTIMYPILDLLGWVRETHDFESRYLDALVGTLPEHLDRYTGRSPTNRVDRLAGPVLLLQGLEDEVCPPEQADRFAAALEGSGIQHAYLTFEGEQHGFRKASTIQTALEAELSFYGQVFGFTPAGVPILELIS